VFRIRFCRRANPILDAENPRKRDARLFPSSVISSDIAAARSEERCRRPKAAENAIEANLKWLGAKPTDARVRLFFVKSRLDMRQFVGGTPGGSAIEMEGTAFLVANDSVRPSLRHETMHLLAWRAWGPPAASWAGKTHLL
jgi:hypothetical protein